MDFERKVIKHFAEKSFSVFNRAPLSTLKNFFGKIVYYNVFKTSMKNMFIINSRLLFKKYPGV